MGRAAIRAVVGHPELTLGALVTSSQDKAGREAAEFAGTEATGVLASTDSGAFEDAGVKAVAYMASGDIRPDDALADIEGLLESGVTVVTPSIYDLYDPASAPPETVAGVEAACRAGGSRLFVSGVDPGWGNDVLPLIASGLCHSITEVRSQEIFDYSTYDQEFSVRELVGMGKPMDEVPPMVAPGVPTMVWGGQVAMMARVLGLDLERIDESVERLPLEADVHNAMGHFEAGTQGALRFEVAGVPTRPAGGGDAGRRGTDSNPIVIEHVTRIDPSVAPHWPQPTTGAGSHRVVVEGEPRLEITVEAESEGGNRAAGGNATAAMRLVAAIPWLLERPAGIYDATDVPIAPGTGRIKT